MTTCTYCDMDLPVDGLYRVCTERTGLFPCWDEGEVMTRLTNKEQNALMKSSVKAAKLHLADEQTIRNLEKKLRFYRKFVDEIDKAFEANKNFMWGDGKWSVISKARKALRELREREEL